jgi:cell division protein FtsA
MKSDISIGIDIGSTKNCCIIAEFDGSKIDILGKGLSPSQGIKKGLIVDIDEAAKGILAAIVDAERTAGFHIGNANVGISGEHISFIRKSIAIPVTGHKEITEEDTHKVMEAVKIIGVPANRKIIQILPLGFTVDNQEGIKNPIGMKAKRLGLKATIITGLSTYLENLEKCLIKIGLEKENLSVIFQPIATSQLLLTHREKETGVFLLDIGGELCEFSVYKEGWLQEAGILNNGGAKITSDIAQIYKIPLVEAERLKRMSGKAAPEPTPAKTMQEVETSAAETPEEQPQSLPKIEEIIEARLMDILESVKTKINHYQEQGTNLSSLVLAGGTACLPGLEALTQKVTALPTRLGRIQSFNVPKDILNAPVYYGALGLVKFSLNYQRKELNALAKVKPQPLNQLWNKVKNWFENLI